MIPTSRHFNSPAALSSPPPTTDVNCVSAPYKGNAFTLTLREISDGEDVEARLKRICDEGVPNYFGHQRFGHQGNNLTLALRWANNALRIKDRRKRSFTLSATRSALFNRVVSQRLAQLGQALLLNGDALQLTGRE